MARKTPAGYIAAFKRILSAWERLHPDMPFGGMTLEQFKAAVQPSFDKRAAVEDARVLLRSLIRAREAADRRSWKLSRLVVHSVLGTPGEGEDGLLYAAVSLLLKSMRRFRTG
jgi:hypothetical protein